MQLLVSLFQTLPDFKGKRRLARLLLKHIIKTKRDMVIKGTDQLQYKVPNFVETIGFEILVNGKYEKETSDFIISRIPVNGVFMDIGANIGTITLPVSKSRPDIRLICIEASRRVYNYLEYNINVNQAKNCQLVHRAVGEKDGEKVSFFSPPELFGKGSMSPVFTDKAEEVETITLDSLLFQNKILKADFIKIDVEGFEYFVFKGGESVLKGDNAPEILFEFVDWAEEKANNIKKGQAQELLMAYGYSIYTVVKSKIANHPITNPKTKGQYMLYATKAKR